jgi:hypothetical protein
MPKLHGILFAILVALVVCCVPRAAFAQTGSIAGTARDTSGGALPGVTVEASSPALIEKVRSTQTDGNGRYQIINLPVGTYSVKFTLQGFSVSTRENVQITSDFTANVVAEMKVGAVTEKVDVIGTAPLVDVKNARQQSVITGEQLRDLPSERNVPALINMVPGITSSRGICSGGVGVFCSPNIPDFNSHTSALDTNFITGQGAGLNQGRVMIDGIAINGPNPSSITGMTNGFNVDVANAQEVSFTLSGALGESETGGAAINIVPRTGGNRNTGNFFTAYTRLQWFDKNNGTRTSVAVLNQELHDYDVNGAFGGPIMKDRLWYYAGARKTGKEAFPFGGNFYPNKNFDPANPTAKPGINYQPDRTQPSVTYDNEYKTINLRLTLQASQKNKFNIYWDEQDSCQDPCTGVVSVFTSPEAWWSVATKPNRVAQLRWTNPLTNRTLLDAGFQMSLQHYDLTKSRQYDTPSSIPRISESGNTAGLDDVATRVNAFAGIPGGFELISGSLNSALGAGGSELRRDHTYRSNASASYITGSHNAKVGYEGAYFDESSSNRVNDQRMTYTYTTPASTCVTNLSCGNTSLYFPDDPNNLKMRPVPTSFQINTGAGSIEDKVWYGALYLQDQWTLNHLTLNGAIRYDHSQSSYGVTCVGPDLYVPVQIGGAYDGQNQYCTVPTDGVNYDDITPRWGVAWDVFGNGKTSIKYSQGRYLAGAGIGGLYTNVNPARRSSNSLSRGWTDNNGDRIPQCDMFNFNAQNPQLIGTAPNPSYNPAADSCASIAPGTSSRYGRDPLALDANGQNPVTTTFCGQSLDRSTDLARAYCDAADQNLVSGWGARQYQWQGSIGVQHELMPRLSAEVTYNWRKYANQTISDVMGLGCDKFNGAQDVTTCQQGYLNYTSPNYDFYTLSAPSDPRLPQGGGYLLKGLNDEHTLGLQPNNGTVVTYSPELSYGWHGVDTNFTLRAKYGIRISGGTSTGRGVRDTCFATLDAPNSKGREGNEAKGGCIPDAQWVTNARANFSYTIPKIDVLASGVFQYRPGVARSANLTYNKTDITWNPDSAARATAPCSVNGVVTTGCFYNVSTTAATAGNTATVDLLDFGDLYGESARLLDLKLAKNVRFYGKRINFGVDVYNLFNSDAALGYNNTYTAFKQPDGSWGQTNPANGVVTPNTWGQVNSLVSPRFARFSMQFDF